VKGTEPHRGNEFQQEMVIRPTLTANYTAYSLIGGSPGLVHPLSG
jgi:hypothetical protein